MKSGMRSGPEQQDAMRRAAKQRQKKNRMAAVEERQPAFMLQPGSEKRLTRPPRVAPAVLARRRQVDADNMATIQERKVVILVNPSSVVREDWIRLVTEHRKQLASRIVGETLTVSLIR